MIKGWTHLHWAAIALSYVLWIALQLLSVYRDPMAVTFAELHSTAMFWFMVLLVPIAGILIDAIVIGRRGLFATPDYRIINEEWTVDCDRNKLLDPYSGIASPEVKEVPEGVTREPSAMNLEANLNKTVPMVMIQAPTAVPTAAPTAVPSMVELPAAPNGYSAPPNEPAPASPTAAEITWPAVSRPTHLNV